jgi:hypothetical protein
MPFPCASKSISARSASTAASIGRLLHRAHVLRLGRCDLSRPSGVLPAGAARAMALWPLTRLAENGSEMPIRTGVHGLRLPQRHS